MKQSESNRIGNEDIPVVKESRGSIFGEQLASSEEKSRKISIERIMAASPRNTPQVTAHPAAKAARKVEEHLARLRELEKGLAQRIFVSEMEWFCRRENI